ncbi:MAG: class I tRNA ligase family protein [Patescibacteria group bacterium]
MAEYNHKDIEKKWQDSWDTSGIYNAQDSSDKPKFYGLIEFPFPSGAGMHVGHLRSNTAIDIVARKRRMEGYNVLYPIGWDAFGLPTENYAIKTGKSPALVTKENTDNFRKQLKSAGFSFDWSREINTTDPAYYKWTQWIFLQMEKNGLAYKKKMVINWCPKDKIGLANEEVVDGTCERCGTVVEKREKEQWMLAITKYADRLDKDLDLVDYQEKIKIQQRNWIGKSQGVNFKCTIKDLNIAVEMYNSVPQTFRAETYTVIAPDHHLVPKLVAGTEYEKDVLAFAEKIKQKKAANKFDVENDMEGIFTGRYIENFAGSGRDLPIWIASYVLSDYGTGIVNASAHDTRDYAFAKKYNIPLHEVLIPRLIDATNPHVPGKEVVFRDAVIAVVKNPKTDKYLCLKWKKQPWTTFVMGGMESGEDAVTSALREIQEETGYKNVKFIKNLGMAQSEFYAAHKGVNRVAHTRNLLFELIDEEQDAIAAEESDTHELVWKTMDEIMSTNMTHSEMPLILDGIKGIEKPIVKTGILLEPAEFKGREWSDVREDVISYLEQKGYAERKVNYKLRDWVFSRQRYWGEPIPMIHCAACELKTGKAWIPVPEKDLPVKLPDVEKYEPTDSGESPLAAISEWVNTTCPECGGPATRETDTMPNWAGSSWYYLRYVDPKNSDSFVSSDAITYWSNEKGTVDWYNGGMEHTTLHLLYSRFWHKFLFDQGLVPTSEPYAKRTSHGLILAADGAKFSKSSGNGVDPDVIIDLVGADALRLYEMFMGPFEQAVSWSNDGVVGPRRFIERVWKMRDKVVPKLPYVASLESTIHKTMKKVSEDIEKMQFNTAVSSLMILLNEMDKQEQLAQSYYSHLLTMLAPFVPHVTEELWQSLGHTTSIHLEKWPKYKQEKIIEDALKIAVQVNGKVRAEMEIAPDTSQSEIEQKAQELAEIRKWTDGKELKRVVYVKGKIVNIVVA